MTSILHQAIAKRMSSKSATGVSLVAVVLLIFAVGCQQNSGLPKKSVATEPDPKAMFEELFKVFHHEVVSDLPQFSTRKDGAFSSLKTNRTVSHELFPPTDADPTCRANITIKTESQFTFRPSQKEGEDADKEGGRKAEDESQDSSDFSFPTLGEIDLTSDAGPAANSSGTFSKGALPPQVSEDEQVYELAFEGGRWVLKTEPDPETERFIKATFDFVLSDQ